MKKNQQIFYKVVDNRLRSARIFYKNGLCVKYQVGSFVYPLVEYTKLFVFDSLWAADKFCSYDWEDIYECEVINPSNDISYYCPTIDDILKMAKARKNKKKFSHLTESIGYEGTVFCDAIKLLERIGP